MVDKRDQDAFDRWLASQRASKTSQQTDLPSSQLPTKSSLISDVSNQVFAVLDTCSIITYRTEFIDHVVHLKKVFAEGTSPIRFIVSLVVLEELDKCNRPGKKKIKKLQSEAEKPLAVQKPNLDCLDDQTKDLLSTIDVLLADDKNSPPGQQAANRLSHSDEPPRLFMRFLEEEMRQSNVITGELDPFKTIKLDVSEQAFEIVNKDDRILECCLRSRAFMNAVPHHPKSSVILISEDNVFKSKATTFGIISYRWREFRAKFKNFGLENYVPTPIVPVQRVNQALVHRGVMFAQANLPSSTKHLNSSPVPKSMTINSIELTKPRINLDKANSMDVQSAKKLKAEIANTVSIRDIYGDTAQTKSQNDDKSVILVAELINLADEPDKK